MPPSTKSLQIGPIRLDLPAVLAPLAGYTDLPYRLINRRLGAPYCATEMILDKHLLAPGKLHGRVVHITPEDHPVAGQIIGNDPGMMAEAAVELCRNGFDVVDLNFACPVPKVLSRRRGGFFMSSPAAAEEVMRAVAAAVDRPWTVKLRKGFEQAGQEFWRIADAALALGAAALCVHARTVRQRYAGPADWDFLAAVKRRYADRTIIGSGDALSPAQAAEMLSRTGVDGVAFARGALGNPWIFRQFADHLAGRPIYRPSLDEQREVLQEHWDHTMALYGPRRTQRIMRSFGIKYARMHPTPGKLRPAFVAVASPADWQAILQTHYGPPAAAV